MALSRTWVGYAAQSSFSQGDYPPLCVQRRWPFENPDSSRTRFRDRPETARLHHGILFTFIREQRSESSRNRVHVPQEFLGTAVWQPPVIREVTAPAGKVRYFTAGKLPKYSIQMKRGRCEQ
jgi:hypothetical protein